MIIKALFLSMVVVNAPNIIVHGDVDMVDENNNINRPITIYVSGNINESSAQSFAREMRDAHRTGQPIIPIVIRSYGGSVYSLLSMIDIIKRAKVPIATIVEGKAMSAGAALLTCGTEGMRYMSPHSTIMIHEVSSSMSGKLSSIKTDTDEMTRLNELMLGIMSENIGQKRSYFGDIVTSRGHVDWYLTPKDAMKHGIINYVGFPEFEINITVNTILK